MTTPKFSLPDQIWAGTEHSLALATEAHAAVMAGIFSNAAAADKPDDEGSYLLSKVDGVGVISIKGGLTNRDSYWNRYSGMVAYDEIRKALVQAAQDESVKSILLDIDSGGGSVAGLADVANLVQSISKGVKSVYAFTDGTMGSAAYWLGSSAKKTYTSQTATMGSIGVIATHIEYSKQLKESGVGVNVIRAGEFKALLNSYEAATKPALDQLQSQLNEAYVVFVQHVADMRGVTFEAADQRMAQGREFFGIKAVEAGLADGVMTFDKLMSRIKSKELDTSSFSNNNSVIPNRGNLQMKNALTDQDIAALAAGAQSVVVAGAAAPIAPTEPTSPVPEPAVAAAAVVPAADASLVTYLQTQVADKTAAVTSLQVELAKATDSIKDFAASQTALVAIAAQSTKNMKVALGFTGVDLSSLSASQIVAEHASTVESFKKKFVAGGVAAISTEADKITAQVDPLHAQRIAATTLK